MFARMTQTRLTLRRRPDHDSDEHGFTMIELMGVVAVIAILVAIGVPIYQQIQVGTRSSATATTAQSIIDNAFALSVQASRAANRGADLADAYADLPSETRGDVALVAWGGTVADGEFPVSGTNYAGTDSPGHLVVLQRFGDAVHAGCAWLPPDSLQGEKPVFFSHGEQVSPLAWEREGGIEVDVIPATSDGDYVDVTAATCLNTNEPIQEGTIDAGEVTFGTSSIAFSQPS